MNKFGINYNSLDCVQINICVNNCIEVIDASVLSSDNSQLKLTTIGHRTGPYSLSELLRLACTLNPRRQFVPLLCDSCLIIKKINCIIASRFVFVLSSHAYNVTLDRELMRRAQGQNTVPHEGFEPRTARYGAPFYCILITKKQPDRQQSPLLQF